MTAEQIKEARLNYYNENVPYRFTHWNDFTYQCLKYIYKFKKAGRGGNKSVNDIIIMADTETSKKPNSEENHIVVWTISLRAYARNIVTLWGNKPSEFTTCLKMIHGNMEGELTYIYFHNLTYDYQFLRKFLFKEFDTPIKQLNTKPHYPIYIEFFNGIILRDSLILAQRNLEKWANDLDVEHKKAIGKWDYDKIRNQDFIPDHDESEYIEHDTLAGVECINVLMDTLHKHIYSMPYTATGIPREEIRKRGKDYRAKDMFNRYVPTYEQYQKLLNVYHGGFTHANRHEVGYINEAQCYDFASSYPFVLLSEKYPMESFHEFKDCKIDTILKNSEKYAFMFKFVAVGVRLKDNTVPMPALQMSKAIKTINAVVDNGRILCSEYVSIYLTEQDLMVISDQYTFKGHICTEVEVASKDYLPRYITDYIFELFTQKTLLKGKDKVLYNLKKAELNSIYGMHVQKCVRDDITEDYKTGDFSPVIKDDREEYEKYCKNRNSILLYQWGVWCTAYAFKNLFELGKCVSSDGLWLYSDTDSCYASSWDADQVKSYNEKCKEKLKANNYGCVNYNGREWWLGVAETDGLNDQYTEFTSLGAKRYCGRSAADNTIHITVAGVPKSGYKCLNDDIKNFKEGTIFSGTVTGKLTHKYIYVDEIYIDEFGNETGDSINLTPCDYLLDSVHNIDWESLWTEEINIQVYDEV